MPPPDATASVSIVLATFNRATMLRAALDSALAQDHADLEVLVMDDGSSDETPAVLAEYAGAGAGRSGCASSATTTSGRPAR